MAIIISQKVREKLAGKIPPVTVEEITQCFADRSGRYLYDTREEHLSDPLTRWFIAETYFGRKLKIAYIPRDPDIHIRTAYDPNQVEIEIFRSRCT